MKRLGPILLALLALALVTVAVSAHQPRYNNQGSPTPEEAFVIATIDVSLAIYGALTPDAAVDYYRIDVPAGHRLDFHVFVPDACGDALRPSIALLGADVTPGLFGLAAVPDYVRAVEGTALQAAKLPPAQWGSFFEPFSRTTYFSGPELAHTAAGGTYYVVVFNPDSGTGTYLLSMAGREAFDRVTRAQDADYEACELPPRAAAVGAAPPVDEAAHVHDESHAHGDEAALAADAGDAEASSGVQQPAEPNEASPVRVDVKPDNSAVASQPQPPTAVVELAASVAPIWPWLLLGGVISVLAAAAFVALRRAP